MQSTPDIADLARRLDLAQRGARDQGWGALLVTPGPDLRYLTGYDAVALERLTCLIVRADADPVVLVPTLERAAAVASPIRELGMEVATWEETDDPFATAAAIVGRTATVGVDDHMWAAKVLGLREAMPGVQQELAGPVLHRLRMMKSPAEVDALRSAAKAIDSVHAAVPELLRPGRTEAEVGRDIADLIVAAGHARVDFVIVASGPNGASPHHEVSGRALRAGDPVVVDIGGTMPSGYCSDETRMYSLGHPGEQYLEMYAVLEQAQQRARKAVRPGVTCEEVDAAARRHLAAAGLGEFFIHRTGHGIGLETHEDPYIVSGNSTPLEAGMCFSIEPGFYLEGRYGARIEDIVACDVNGVDELNERPHGLVTVDA